MPDSITITGHKKNSACCYQYKRMKTSEQESLWQKYSLPIFTILNDGLGSWKSTMDCCHVQRCFPIFTLEKERKYHIYLWPVTATNQNWQKKPTKKQQTHKPATKRTFLSSFLYTPLFKLFLCTFARQMLAMTSQHDMVSFSQELLLVTLPAVSDNSRMPTHSHLCPLDSNSQENDDSTQFQQQVYVQPHPFPRLKPCFKFVSWKKVAVFTREVYTLY